MTKNNNIPILKGESFSREYFKDKPAAQGESSLQHFEINRRCLWKNQIGAHRLDFYMVFLVTEGEGIHTFGLKDHYIKKNMLCFVSPGMISAWQSEGHDNQGIFCTFSDDFFNLGSVNRQFLRDLPFFQIDGNAVLHLTDAQADYYLALFRQMLDEYAHRNGFSDNILRSQLHVLLHKANAQYSTQVLSAAPADHAGLRLLKAFTTCYMRDFNVISEGNVIQLKTVAAYADELGVSQNHLNDTVKAITGKSAGQLVKNQLIKQATMCLKHSEKSISEIAYRLGYEDPSYFARYYKSQTGKSPSEFRAGGE